MQLQYEEEKKDRMPCEHLLRTGSCAYGQECRFRHTRYSSSGGILMLCNCFLFLLKPAEHHSSIILS